MKRPGMRLHCVGALVLLSAAFSVERVSLGGEAGVELRYRLKPGTELRYKTEGTMKQKMSMPQGDVNADIKLAVAGRTIVAEVDPKTGVMLIGALTNTSISAEMQTPQGKQSMTQEISAAMALRAAPTGKVIPRKRKEDDDDGRFLGMLLRQLAPDTLDGLSFPEGEVSVGGTWEAESTLPVSHLPLRAKVTSTLSEIKQVGGRPCAVVKGKLSTGRTDDDLMPGMDVTGRMEVLFDLERGLCLEKKIDATAQMDAGGVEMEMKLHLATTLESVRALDAGEAARHVMTIRTLDEVLNKLYAGEAEKAISDLEKLKKSETAEEWGEGIGHVITIAKQMKNFGSRAATIEMEEDEEKLGPEQKILREAEAEAQSGNWKEAVVKYLALAEKHPDHKLAPQALSAAASISEKRLGDGDAAREIRRKLVAMQEEKAGRAADEAASPMEVYKLARSYADAGDLEKAVETYRRFAAIESKDVPARFKVLARYRIGRLLEKLGRTREALAAYRAVGDIPADDDYSGKIKKSAREKAAKLEASENR